MRDVFDTIVIGGGIIGRLAAWYSGRSGRYTLLLEKNSLDNPEGSSKGDSRVFGEAFADNLYYQMARQSRYLWQELEGEIGEKLLYLNGGLDISISSNLRGNVSDIVSVLKNRGSSFEVLDSIQISRRYPQWRCGSNAYGIYSPDTGILDAERCMRAVTLAVKKHEVVMREQTEIVSVQPHHSGTFLVKALSGETFHSQKVIIAAGPWAKNILASLGVNLPLTISQEQIVYFTPFNPELFKPDNFPTWEWDGDDFVYGIPIFEKNGIKIAFHRDKYYLNSLEEFSHVPRVSVIKRLREFINKHLPDAGGEEFGAMTCLYTNTPDLYPVIDIVSGLPQIAYFAGCNGNAFHKAPAIGKILNELVYGGKTSIDISRFSGKRFKV